MTPAAMDSTRVAPPATAAAVAVGTSGGLTAITAPSAATGSGLMVTPGNCFANSLPRGRQRLGDGELAVGRPAAGPQAAEQRLAHPAATDDHQLHGTGVLPGRLATASWPGRRG